MNAATNWIILNEGTEHEELTSPSEGCWYVRNKGGGDVDWFLYTDRGDRVTAGYSDQEYQDIKNSLLGRNKKSETEALRDQFAMAAMQGILSDSEAFYQTFDALAGDCYAIADAMLKARGK